MNATLEKILELLELTDVSWDELPIHLAFFTRENLAELFHELGFETGVEIGVEKGHYSRMLCEKNSRLKLYGVDPYEPYHVYLAGWIGENQSRRARQRAIKNLEGLNVELLEMTSMEAVERFDDNSLDFVYVDGDHSFLHVVQDTLCWSEKVRSGGIIAGHDYMKKKSWRGTHVVPAINAITRIYQIRPWFVFDEETKTLPSWMWVKE